MMTPTIALATLDRFDIKLLSRDVLPREDDRWGVVDTKTADPETNWPGELVSEHATHTEARVGMMKAVLSEIETSDGLALHQAYLRLRDIIPGAHRTPFAPSSEQVFEVTESAARASVAASTFQARNLEWLAVVTKDDPTDLPERRARYGEESLELLQAAGMTRDEVLQLVDYVFSRPVGEPGQEVGGAFTCLTGLCTFLGLDMQACGEAELARVWTPEMIEKIRRKRATRHGRGPLPGFSVVEHEYPPC